jgi:hypothetical protein
MKPTAPFRRLRIAKLLVALVVAGTAPALLSQHVVTFDLPASSYTHPTSINFRGEITGYYLASNGDIQGFVRHANGSLKSFIVPQPPGGFAPNAIPMEINDWGQITGFYQFEVQLHGFVRQPNGTIVQFLPPPASQAQVRANVQTLLYDKPMCGGEDHTVPLAINDLGQIAGSTPGLEANASGFLRTSGGAVDTFDVAPPSPFRFTCPQAINLWGQVTGYYTDSNGAWTAFLRRANGGIISFGHPGAVETVPTAINLFAQVTGFYQDSIGFHGFTRLPNGTLLSFDPAGSINTQPTAINDLGEISGFYSKLDGIAHSFLREANGRIVTFDVPNSQGTYARSLNLLGTVTGEYFDGNTYHGFVRRK